MTTTVGTSTSYPLTIPELSETADIQTALKLVAYGQSADPTNDADIESNSLAGYISTKANISGPTFTGTVVLPSTTSIGTITSTELGYLDGVTSAIQTQFTAKANLAGPTFTGTVVLPSTTSIGNVSSTEISYLDGVTSAIQTQIGTKANSAGPTFTGTVVLPSTTSIGNVSSTEIGYLDGVTDAIQTQLGNKQTYSATLAGITTLGSGTGFLKNTAGTFSYDNSTYLTASSPTITTPTINTVNTSFTTTGTAALWNTGITTGTISIGGAITTGTVNIASSAAGAKTVNIGTSTGIVNINGTANVGKALLETVTTSAGASTITFSSISQSYKSLEVVYTLGTGTELSGTSNTVSIRFSGDTGNNYAYSFATSSSSAGSTNTTAPSYSNGFDQAQILVPVSHKDTTAIGSFTIDNYNSTAGSKIGFYNLYQDYLSDQITTGTFAWKNRTTAITSMTITFNGSVITGQVVTAKLFGIN